MVLNRDQAASGQGLGWSTEFGQGRGRRHNQGAQRQAAKYEPQAAGGKTHRCDRLKRARLIPRQQHHGVIGPLQPDRLVGPAQVIQRSLQVLQCY